MTRSRSKQVSLQDTRYYHLISRCVRRAYLCGEDAYTKQSYEHRRQWMVDRIRFLTSIFAIDVASYAVMSNHYHLVVYVDESEAMAWSDKEVCERWQKLYHNHPLVERLQKGQSSCQAEIDKANEIINKWRMRLADLSWLMRNLNEYIARKANQEDNCTGHFWEGRFKSQALLDEAALAACMAYVDLNPVRANIAKTPESSGFTSVKQRVKAAIKGKQPKLLLPFVGNPRQPMPKGLPFELTDYLELIELTGRCIREDKAGHIEQSQPALLARLNINPENWLTLSKDFRKLFHGAVGHSDVLSDYCEHKGLKRRTNVNCCDKLLA